jgi:hypothetical protein
MADRVPKITEEQKPTFNAAAYSDRLQETRQAAGALPAAPVFDKTKPDSIVPLAQYTRVKLTDTVNALSDFTAAHEVRLNAQAERLDTQAARIAALEAQPTTPPFPA